MYDFCRWQAHQEWIRLVYCFYSCRHLCISTSCRIFAAFKWEATGHRLWLWGGRSLSKWDSLCYAGISDFLNIKGWFQLSTVRLTKISYFNFVYIHWVLNTGIVWILEGGQLIEASVKNFLELVFWNKLVRMKGCHNTTSHHICFVPLMIFIPITWQGIFMECFSMTDFCA